MAKITKTTLKAFIRNNKNHLFIKHLSRFDGMTDCVESINGDYAPVTFTDNFMENTLGIEGVWLVTTSGGNRFHEHENEKFEGFTVHNCCGSFIIAVKKNI